MCMKGDLIVHKREFSIIKMLFFYNVLLSRELRIHY